MLRKKRPFRIHGETFMVDIFCDVIAHTRLRERYGIVRVGYFDMSSADSRQDDQVETLVAHAWNIVVCDRRGP